MIFHIDLDAFFASIEQRDNPKLRGKPVIVGGPDQHRGVVAAASYEARQYGIHSAMPLFKAFALCKDLILVPPNFKKYEQESDRFYQILLSFTPFIEGASIDEAYASFYGFEAYYGDFKKTALRIKQTIQKKLSITASVGVATNKTVAKVASNYQKPNGLTIVSEGFEKAFLSPLPIRSLPGLGIKTEEQLERFGIKTIGQLARIKKQKLQMLLGKNGLSLWEASNGMGQNHIVRDEERKSLGAETTLLFDSKDPSIIEQTLYFLVLRTASDLREEGKKAGGLSIKLRTSRFETTTHQKTLSFTTNDTKELYQKAKELLYASWDRRLTLRLIGISTFNLTNVSQESLFDLLPKAKNKVEPALDIIRKKYGFWSIMPGVLLNKKATLKKISKGH